MKFSSINPSLRSSYKMTNENVRLNSSLIRKNIEKEKSLRKELQVQKVYVFL